MHKIFMAVTIGSIIFGGNSTSPLAQVPSEFFGDWTSNLTTCVPDADVTILNVDAATVSWYEYSCNILRSSPSKNGISLAVDCVKGGGSKGVGTINLSQLNKNLIDARFSEIGDFSGAFSTRLARCPIGKAMPAQPHRSHWQHNGSLMYLVTNGVGREFFYQRPRDGLTANGVAEDTLLFNGQVVNGSYVGTARIFRGRCGQFAYRVSGPISDNGRRVVMRGEAPRINKDCEEIGSFTDTLEFSLVTD